MAVEVTLSLPDLEHKRLSALADKHMRSVTDEIRYIIKCYEEEEHQKDRLKRSS